MSGVELITDEVRIVRRMIPLVSKAPDAEEYLANVSALSFHYRENFSKENYSKPSTSFINKDKYLIMDDPWVEKAL